MSITAQPLLQLPAGTALGPAGAYCWGPGDAQEPAIVGTVTFTGDASTTTAVINWIDGTATLPFTPRVVRATLVLGTGAGTDTAGVLAAEGSAVASANRVFGISNTGATVKFSTAPGAATIVLLIEIFK